MVWLLVACAAPDPAPRDLDTVIHDLWVHNGQEADDALTQDMRDLAALIDETTLPIDGTISALTAEEVAAAGVTGPDPATARGMFSAGFVDCTPSEMEAILISLDQMTLYPENYREYERTYTSDPEAYAARDTHHLTWDTHYTVEIPIVATYTADVHAGAHWTPDGAAGPYLFSFTAMPGPADPVQENVSFDVDYQIEAFYPHEGGMVHVFGMWRHLVMGDLSTDDDGVVSLILGGLHDWDESTTAICEEGRI